MGVYEELCSLVDMEFPPMVGVDAVCPQMIRHWCEAMQEDNPLYLDEDYGSTQQVWKHHLSTGHDAVMGHTAAVAAVRHATHL